jgi:hypothetical protein
VHRGGFFGASHSPPDDPFCPCSFATLTGSVSSLVDGTNSLTDETSTLTEGSSLSDEISALPDGTSSRADGTNSLTDECNSWTDGTSSRVDGTNSLTDGTGLSCSSSTVLDVRSNTCIFTSGFYIRMYYAFLLHSLRATCPASPILSSLCSFLNFPSSCSLPQLRFLKYTESVLFPSGDGPRSTSFK